MVSTAAACTTAAPPPTPAAPILEQPATTGVFANLYLPPAPDTARDAAVLVLGGSEGGFQLPNITARDLAAHGHPAMALAYFGSPGLPTALRDIPWSTSPPPCACSPPNPASTPASSSSGEPHAAAKPPCSPPRLTPTSSMPSSLTPQERRPAG